MPKYVTQKGPARTRILSCIRINKQGLTSTEIAEYSHASIHTVRVVVKGLIAQQLVRKVPIKRGYIYFHRSVRDEEATTAIVEATKRRNKKELDADKILDTNKYSVDLEPDDIYKFLVKWQHKWQPRIFDSARNLPLGLARIFELAIEQSYASHISDNDLAEVRVSIDRFKQDLERTLRIVNGILNEPRLWDRHRLAIMTTADHNIEETRTIAFKVKEAN